MIEQISRNCRLSDKHYAGMITFCVDGDLYSAKVCWRQLQSSLLQTIVDKNTHALTQFF